jgi:phthalate 4,5-cis-dihydrodiol dehydrogenase
MGVELRVGLAGLGAAAYQVAPGFNKVEGVRFTAVADIRPEALKLFKERLGVAAFKSVEEMCRSGEVDAVYVATPNHFHAEHTIIAAECGKHVICEKPMAITIDEANRMVEAVRRCGVRYVQGHSKIHRPSIKAMGQVIASGRLGRVFHINTWNYNAWMRSPWEAATLDPKRGGGVVFRQGPHQMDIVRYLGGGVVRSVRGVTGRWYPYFDVEGNYAAFLDFESGATALLSFSAYGHFNTVEVTWGRGEGGQKMPDEVIYGPRRTPTAPLSSDEYYRQLEARAMKELEKELGPKEGASAARDVAQDFFGVTIVSCERGDIRQSEHGLYIYTEKGREEIPLPPTSIGRGAPELAELKASIEENRPVFPDAGWGRASLEACLAIMESSRGRREVYLQQQTPSPIRVTTAGTIG